MRIVRAARLAALSMGLLTALAAAQAPPDKAAEKADPGLFGGLFATRSRPPAKAKAKDGDKEKEAADRPSSVADRAAEQERLMKGYLRRLAVCDRLRDIAHETNNPALAEEAGRLDELAWKVYQEQSNQLLGVKSMAMEPDAAGSGAALPDAGKALRKASGGGALPPRIWSEGRIEPVRSEGRSPLREEMR
ncbi:MAG: hypothetical protein U0736_20385 [Gemmataceae bacterium]